MARTQILLDVTGQTGALAGSWFNVDRSESGYMPVEFELLAGTVTAKLQGRNYPGANPVDITTFTGTDGLGCFEYPQIRINITAATGASVKATTGRPVRS